jgi:anti-sigma B factor antagonist
MLDIDVSEKGAVHSVRLVGELSAVEAERVEKTIGELCVGDGARLAVDLSGLRTIDSCGLSALIHLATRARMTGGRVMLAAPSPFVAGILAVTRLDQWFEIAATPAEAERQLGQY